VYCTLFPHFVYLEIQTDAPCDKTRLQQNTSKFYDTSPLIQRKIFSVFTQKPVVISTINIYSTIKMTVLCHTKVP